MCQKCLLLAQEHDEEKDIEVADVFDNGTELYDYYSGQTVKVVDGAVIVDSEDSIVLLGIK